MAASRKPSPSRPVCGRLCGAARRFFAVLLPCVPVAAVIALGLSLIGAADRTGVDKTVLIAELCAKNLTGLADCDGQRGGLAGAGQPERAGSGPERLASEQQRQGPREIHLPGRVCDSR